jgi:thymidylate synthase (FAD)
VIEHAHITVRFITDRGITHELVRHRLASFSQESTRYVNYDKRGTVFIDAGFLLDNPHARIVWKHICTETAKAYSKMLEKGVSPQFARNVLPNSLKTEIVMTANLREWVTILKQRTSPAAHPQMRQLMEMFLSELRKKNPALFKCLVSALN